MRDYATEWVPDSPDRMELAKKLSPLHIVRKGLPPFSRCMAMPTRRCPRSERAFG